MVVRQYPNPNIQKSRKKYICLVCMKEIPEGSSYVNYSHKSEYLREAFENLTKYSAWAKFVEILVTLHFCSGRCFRKWQMIHGEGYVGESALKERYFKIILETRNRRLRGWKDWKVWKEIFDPLDRKWRKEC